MIIAPHFDFSNRQNRRPAIRIRIMIAANGSAPMNWDDVRVFLAVARNGSLRAAGRALGLSQPTIGRRLAGFEASFGGPALFDRLPEGLRLNAAGESLVEAAERLERAALALERRRAAASPALSGTVRVSVGEWAAGFLARHLSGSSAADLASGITLELLERLTAPVPELAADYWVIVHRDLRRAACVRAVIDWVQALFASEGDALAGAR